MERDILGLYSGYGLYPVIYMRFSRWVKSGVLERVYAALAGEGLQDADVRTLDSTSVKAHTLTPSGV
jgi:hypothetical protein